MGLTMKKILNRFDDCNKFCLTGSTLKYNFTISEEEYNKATQNMNFAEREKFTNQFIDKYTITKKEFDKALNNIKNKTKTNLENLYKINKDKLKDFPDFDALYEEIEKECYEFGNEENREYYTNKYYNDEKIESLKKDGYTCEEIEKEKKDHFRYSFITNFDEKPTKYGMWYHNLIYRFYREIAWNIDREQTKTNYCIDNGKAHLSKYQLN